MKSFFLCIEGNQLGIETKLLDGMLFYFMPEELLIKEYHKVFCKVFFLVLVKGSDIRIRSTKLSIAN
jgi:hypothetical protein